MTKERGGRRFVITAPSGAGKSSLIKELLKADPALGLSISYTTRPPRPGEKNGREYHFVDDPTFLAMRERGVPRERGGARQSLRHFEKGDPRRARPGRGPAARDRLAGRTAGAAPL